MHSPPIIITPLLWLRLSVLLLVVGLGLGLLRQRGAWSGLIQASSTETAPLPRYDLELYQDGHQHLCPPGVVGRLSASSILTLMLRPARQVHGPVQATAYRVSHGQYAPWPLEATRAPSGVFRIRSQVAAVLDRAARSAAVLDRAARSAAVNDLEAQAQAESDQLVEIAFALSRPGGPVQQILHARFEIAPFL